MAAPLPPATPSTTLRPLPPPVPRRPATVPPPVPPPPHSAVPPPLPPLRSEPLRVRRSTEDPSAGLRSPLVGRDQPLSILRDVVSRAVDFQAPQLVTVVGNQGTGKSRLIAELVAGLTPPTRVFRGQAVAGQKWSAIASLLSHRFGLDTNKSDARERIEAHVTTLFGVELATAALHCLGRYLDLDFPPSPFQRLIGDDPQQAEQLPRIVLRRLVELDAEHTPVVLVLDDMHLADDDTLATLTAIAAHLGGSPVVIVAATRPEMLVRCPAWGQGAVDHEQIDVRNLEPEEAEVMFCNLLARCGRPPDEVVQAALETTGGNPAFLESLVRLYLTSGAIDVTGPRWRLDIDRALETELPIGIEEAIEARIAALENDERRLLQKGAVFGNVFWLSAVVALTRLEDGPLDFTDPLDLEWGQGERIRRRLTDLIHSLAERDYLLVLDAADSTVPGSVEVVFKHNLERDLVVKSTEAGAAARYALSAAQWLEARLIDKSEEQLEFLTALYEQGGDMERAARCYLLGADRARGRYANEEARSMYERGLSMMGDGDAPARMDALHNLGDVLDLAGETELAMARFNQMLDLAWRYDNLRKAGAAHTRIARVLRRLGQYDPAMQHLRRAHELFSAALDDRGIAATLDDIGRVHWLRGAYSQALDFHRQALTIRKSLGDRRSIALSEANIGRVHHDSGNFKPAIAHFRQALDLRRDVNDLGGVVQSLTDLAGVWGEAGNHLRALEHLAEAEQLAVEIGDKPSLAKVLSRVGEHKTALGRADEAVADLARARSLAAAVDDPVVLVETRRRTAEAELARGNLDAAEHEVTGALALAEQVGARVQIGNAHRTLGAIAWARGDGLGAEEQFRRAIDILGTMRNELELARAFQVFADFRAARGETAEAATFHQRAAEVFARLHHAASRE